jgi:hypothetical protein
VKQPGGSPGFGRRRMLLPLSLVALVIAGGVAALLGFVVFRSTAPGVPKASPAQVKARALSAIEDSDNLILHSVQTSTEYGYSSTTGETTRTVRQDRWQDMTTNRTLITQYDSNNQPQMEWSISVSGGTSTSSLLNYAGHSWVTFSNAVPAQAFAGNGSEHLAQSLEDQLASGMLTLVGSQTIDGHAALHVRWTLPMPPLPPNASGFTMPRPAEVDMWLDPTTYLPIRQESLTSKGEVLSQTDDVWLPRTPENLAKLKFVVPPGFTRQSASSGSSTGGSFSFGQTQITHP